MNGRVTILAGLVSIAAANLHAQESSTVNPVFQNGEWLQYKVKFGPFRLGTVRFLIQKVNKGLNDDLYRIDLRMDSNPALFFIRLHESTYNIVHAESLYSEYSCRTRETGGRTIESIRTYDRAGRTCTIEEYDVSTNKLLEKVILTDVDPYFEGPSLWSFTRSMIRMGANFAVGNIIDTVRCQTLLSFDHPRSVLDVDAFESRVRARQAQGNALWKGDSFGGLSGDFRGWFTDDDASVPLLAYFKIALGSIVLELEEWHRPGWSPPTAESAAWR